MWFTLCFFGCPSALSPTDSAPTTDPPTPLDTATDTDLPPTHTAVALYPSQAGIRVGETLQLRAQGLWTDGSTTNDTPRTFFLAHGDAGSLTPHGLFTAASPGTVDVLAEVDGQQVTGRITVFEHPVDVQIAPQAPLVPVHSAPLFTAQSQGSDLSASCAWSSSDPNTLAVGAAGAASALSPGEATLTAVCGDSTAHTIVTVVAHTQPANLSLVSLHSEPLEGAAYRVTAQLRNTGGYSGTFFVDFIENAADPSTPDQRWTVPGLATGETRTLVFEGLHHGPRPATINSWVVLDADQRTSDLNRTDNSATVPTELPEDTVADLKITFDRITVFGPAEAGVVFTVRNLGPGDLTDLTIHFERDEPTASSLLDLDPGTAERHVRIPHLAHGASWLWVFDFDQVPFDAPWMSCGFSIPSGYVDPDLHNNLGCGEFPVY